MPASSIAQSSATTRGRARSGARSVASASPTVCTVCSPAPTSRNASAAATSPTHSGPVVSPDRISSANGMIAKPPNCVMRAEPDERDAPPAEHRAMMIGAETDHRAQRREHQRQRQHAVATIHDGTASSTIITRLSVPISSTAAMPTVTWNSDSRSRRPIGSSAVAASANGSRPRQNRIRPWTRRRWRGSSTGAPPAPAEM